MRRYEIDDITSSELTKLRTLLIRNCDEMCRATRKQITSTLIFTSLLYLLGL